MLPVKTIVVGIVALGVGAVGSVRIPAAAKLLGQPQKLPITATKGADGVTFDNPSPGSRFLIVGLSDQQPTGLSRDIGAKTLSNGTSVFFVYEVTRRFIYRDDQLGECLPTAECPLPPPCPTAQNCPWRVVQVSELKPRTP